MNKVQKNILSGIVACFASLAVFAQVQISFQPVVHGRSIEGVTFFQINNQTSADFNASLRIIITEEKAGKLAELTTASIFVKRGLSTFNRSLLGALRTRFTNNQAAAIARQTGKLPEGEYEYCFELTPIDEKPGLLDYYESCFHLSLQPLSPLLLLDPLDEEKICNQKPNFLWQAPMPVDFNARYRILVAEVKGKQTAVEALSFNQPVINVSELREPRLNFPMTIRELEKGKTYAWQTYYSVNNVLLMRSEIWTFTIDCEEEKTSPADDSYRELKTAVSGDFYIANRVLRFAVTNLYNEGPLKYSIVNLKEPEKEIQHLAELKLGSGLNKYELDLSAYRAFRNGEHYQLQVQLPNGQKLYLRFTYQD